MKLIRAHFDGQVVVPDEPVKLLPQSRVMILVEEDDPAAEAALAAATRAYYEQQSAQEREEDEQWGRGVARESHKAWE